MIWRLLRKNISIGQIAGYTLATLIGLTIVMGAVRFYGDVDTMLHDDEGENGLISDDFMVISKTVSLMNTLGAGGTDFSEDEIEDIKAQPWVTDVGAFTSADFNVGAAVQLGGRGMQSYMFLEAIPDQFIDIRPDDWHFDSDNPEVVPIILSKDYLALYNFGFATSRGLPQLSEGLISQVPITLYMNGNGHMDQMRARIVGFSSRLNTIAVPQAFMDWANHRYSESAPTKPSRLILRINKPGDPAIEKYLKRNDYEAAGDKLDTGRASYFLTLLTSIVITIGIIISALALFILILSIHLLLQKNREKINNLLLLGYSPGQVAAGYYRLIGIINLSVLCVAIVAMLLLSRLWQGALATMGAQPASPWPAILIGTTIMAVITAINFLTIKSRVAQ